MGEGKVVTKKVWPEYFDAIEQGKKKFELRLADFDVQEGDTLVLEEWDPKTKQYTGRTIEKKVTFVFRFKPDEIPFWTKEDIEQHGLQILSLE
jgi:ASC-1-like (ASCH) protein